MDYKKLTAPCGLDCFNCGVYAANITEATKMSLAAMTGKEPADIPCRGCRTSGCTFLTEPCATLDCISQKGHEFCYECNDFPCDKFLPCRDSSEKPHNMKLYNLCRIQRIGLEKWAQEAVQIRGKYYTGILVIGKGPVLKP